MSLRSLIKSDTQLTVESQGDWGMRVILFSSNGEKQNKNYRDIDLPEIDQKPLTAQVQYHSIEEDADTGVTIPTPDPVVSITFDSIDFQRMGQPNKKWIVIIPPGSDPDGEPSIKHQVYSIFNIPEINTIRLLLRLINE